MVFARGRAGSDECPPGDVGLVTRTRFAGNHKILNNWNGFRRASCFEFIGLLNKKSHFLGFARYAEAYELSPDTLWVVSVLSQRKREGRVAFSLLQG